MEALTQASHKIAEAMYSQAGSAAADDNAAGEAGPSAGEEKADDDVIDAEYVDVDDNKKDQ